MEKKNLIQYVLLALIAFVFLIGILNLFKSSKNLKDAINSIDEAKEMVDKSLIILKNQEIVIDSIKRTNSNLLGVMKNLESQNINIRESITGKFKKNSKDLDSIKVLLQNKDEVRRPQ